MGKSLDSRLLTKEKSLSAISFMHGVLDVISDADRNFANNLEARLAKNRNFPPHDIMNFNHTIIEELGKEPFDSRRKIIDRLNESKEDLLGISIKKTS